MDHRVRLCPVDHRQAIHVFCPHLALGAGGALADRMGKGIRTAPRDALVAGTVMKNNAGWLLACTGPGTRREHSSGC